MKNVQHLVQRFLAREINIKDLQSQFAQLLQDDPALAARAAAWLDACEQDGLLSESLCTSLKNVLVAYIAAANQGPDPRDSGVFDAIEIGAPDASHVKAAKHAAGAEALETFVREEPDDDATRLNSDDKDTGDSKQWSLGSVVGGRYELVENIGAGGMGMVFKARDRLREEAQDRNPFVALKVMSEEFKRHPDSMIALQREVRRAQALAHPNVITVHEFFRDGPHFYMTMELLEGKPLDVLLNSDLQGGVPMERAWPIIEGVGNALQYGHDKGIVHSDVKPGNIFVCDDGAVKALDLGISRPIPVADAPESDQTVFDAGKRLGGLTPAYAALEMWVQDTPDPRDDIYALACVSYQLLTGRHPFDGQSARKAYDAQLAPERIETISRSQWSALAKGLSLRRGDRTPSVNAFLKGLGPQSVVRARRRNVALAAALVAAIVGAVGVWYYGIVVEDRALDDRGRMSAQSDVPQPRPDLTPDQVSELNDLVQLGQIQISQLDPESSAEDVLYLLSTGPNNAAQIVNAVLDVDPGYESALELRRRAFDLILQKARTVSNERPDIAMSMTRAADAMISDQSEVLRLQRSICRDAPEVCR